MRVLVTGGAGYIGSHAVAALRESGHEPIVIDNLSRGHRVAVPEDVVFHELDILDTKALTATMTDATPDVVLHFAGLAYVGESVTEPLRYYQTNVEGTRSVLEAMELAGVDRIVFSSSCATYGVPDTLPITEDTPQKPINPYGRSKLMAEQLIADAAAARPTLGYALLRYFNAAGSSLDGSLGEDHDPEPHLIPNVLRAAREGSAVTIHGTDYDTADGTCVRDYLHVEDLIGAHLLVMERLAAGSALVYNLGTGHGASVKEVIAAAEQVTQRSILVSTGPRRPGDPPMLTADAHRITAELGWQPTYNLETMITSAAGWQEAHPTGYDEPTKAASAPEVL